MNFGPSTPLLQQAILTLLQGRNPSPLAPVSLPPVSTPPSLPPPRPLFGASSYLEPPIGPPPEPAPVAPAPALDQALIEQLTGPRPVAPVTQPVSLLQKIALALQGFGAGTQGYGPQFLSNLQEQRERPQREFRAATEQYESNRRRAIGIAEEKRQQGQADIQRRADIQSGREFQLYEGELRDRRQEARDLRLQAAQLEREERREQAEKRERDAQEAKQVKLKAADLASKYRLAGAKEFSNELAERDLGLRDKVSPAADKWLSSHVQLEQARLNKITSGGTEGGAGNAASLERQFNALKAQFLRAEKPTESAPYGDRALQSRIAAQYPAVMNKLAKLGYEVGFDPSGIYPYIKPPQGRQPAQPTAQSVPPQGQQKDSLGIR